MALMARVLMPCANMRSHSIRMDGYADSRQTRVEPGLGRATISTLIEWEHAFGTRGIDLSQLRPVRFTWRPYLIRGRMNLFAGEESMGKSALQAWLAAQITRGKLPGEFDGQRGRVLWVGADEDDWYEVVTPRLYALGADLSLVREFVPLAD